MVTKYYPSPNTVDNTSSDVVSIFYFLYYTLGLTRSVCTTADKKKKAFKVQGKKNYIGTRVKRENNEIVENIVGDETNIENHI